jgi:hypothetical protein
MTGAPLTPTLVLLVAIGLAGFVFGFAYFAAVQRTALLFAAGRGWLAPVALTVGRIGAAVLFLTLAARLGAAPLLAGFAGFLLARAVALRVARRPG